MTDKERAKIFKNALELSCKFIRKYPAGELEAYFNNDMVELLAGGTHRDPDGLEFVLRFVNMAIEEKNIK